MECGELAARYGLRPDPWQQLVLDSWLACSKGGQYLSETCGLAVPRQNGKNAVLEMVELFKAAIQGRKVLHTAHEVKTCRKAFLRLKSFFDDPRRYPELAGCALTIRQTNGQEAIVLSNGGSIEFIARSKCSGLGFTVDDLVCDEAQELTDEQLEALRPTLSAAPSQNPQFILTGTPPRPSSPGTVFARTRKSAIDGAAEAVCWLEWSVPEIGNIKDRRRWEQTNPALGRRVMLDSVKGELASMSEDGFARERLGWWMPEGNTALVTQEQWAGLATNDPPADGRVAYGVKFSPDGATVALAVALRPPSGPVHVEVVEHRSMREGIDWLSQWLIGRWRSTSAITVDGLTGASALIEKLDEAKVSKKAIVPPKTAVMVAAAAMTLNAMHEKAITHFDQPVLNRAVLNAYRRQIGSLGGWGWGGSQDIDVTPIDAVSLAYWGVMTSKRNPSRKQRLL